MKKNEQTIELKKYRSEGERMHFDDYVTLTLPKKDHATFMNYMTERTKRFKWEQLTDSMDKAWFVISINIVRKLTPDFMEQYDDVSIDLNYQEAAVLNRMVKIIQVEIGEENDDQQFFQQIASELFKIL